MPARTRAPVGWEGKVAKRDAKRAFWADVDAARSPLLCPFSKAACRAGEALVVTM